MESAYYLAFPNTTLMKFSEQHLMDCNPWKDGCQGAYPDRHFDEWMISDSTFRAFERLVYAKAPLDYI